jgi:hypothetical protein
MGKPASRAVAVLLAGLLVAPALAADKLTQRLNQDALGLMVSEVAWLPRGLRLAHALTHEDDLRILPIAGDGSVQALIDLIHLQSVDAALVSSDALAYAQSHALLQGKEGKLSYTARIAPLEAVLIARNGYPNVTSLAGRRIATGPVQSASFATGELLFGALELPFKRVPLTGPAALEALRTGAADAALMLGTDFERTSLAGGSYRVLPIPLPPSLVGSHSPAILTADQLPGLMPPGESIETVSSSLIIAVFNWPRNSEHYYKLRRFTAALAAQPDAAGTGAGNLAVQVPGWNRHASASEALKLPGPAGQDTITQNTE